MSPLGPVPLLKYHPAGAPIGGAPESCHVMYSASRPEQVPMPAYRFIATASPYQ